MGCDLADLTEPKEITFEQLANRTVAVDAYNTLYQFLSSIRQSDGTPLMDSKGRQTGHLSGLFYRSLKWIDSGIKPVFVFDGKPPELKRKTLDERKRRKEEAQKKMQKALEAGDEESAKKYAQQTSKLTREMAENAKTLLKYLGIPYLQAPSEGEAEAADLVIRGLAYASASQDYDSLLFGATRLVRNLSTTGRRKVPRQNRYIQVEPQMVELAQVLKTSGLNNYQLIWIAILSGTDFNSGVYGIGPKKALKLVHNAKSFEQAISRLPESAKAKMNEGEIEGLESWQQIEEFFLKPPVSACSQIPKFEPDEQKAISFLVDEFDFSQDRIERTISSHFKKQKETGGQTTLGSW
ncbi:MAG: flap endonuclease-1 [Candidatus Micrarchaeota archaeon]